MYLVIISYFFTLAECHHTLTTKNDMPQDALSHFLGDTRFLDFAIEYNDLKVGSKEIKHDDELGIILQGLKEFPNNPDAISYIYSVQDFTETLLDTLKNYNSKAILSRILTTLPSNIVQHPLGKVDIYNSPSDFTSIFSYNYLYGLQSLADFGSNQYSILSDRKSFGNGYSLAMMHAVDIQTGRLIIQAKIGFTEETKYEGTFFHSHKTIYEKNFSQKALFDYIQYRHPNKNLFDLLNVSFDDVLIAKHG